MTKTKFLSILGVISMPFLAGCAASNTSDDFLCPVQVNGSPCATISEADGSGQSGVTPVSEQIGDTMSKQLSGAPLGISSGKLGKGAVGAPLSAMGDGGFPYSARQYRTPEQVGTLWLAPHLDAEGLLHEATYVHFVVREAQWNAGRQ